MWYTCTESVVRALAERRIAVIQDDKEKSLQRVRNGIIRAQSNFFRFARYNLTLTEQKMIYFAIMTGEQTKKPFSPVLMPVKDGFVWNLFPVYNRELEGFANVYCYFSRRGGNFDENFVDVEYDQLNNFRASGYDKGDATSTGRLNDPNLRYDNPW